MNEYLRRYHESGQCIREVWSELEIYKSPPWYATESWYNLSCRRNLRVYTGFVVKTSKKNRIEVKNPSTVRPLIQSNVRMWRVPLTTVVEWSPKPSDDRDRGQQTYIFDEKRCTRTYSKKKIISIKNKQTKNTTDTIAKCFASTDFSHHKALDKRIYSKFIFTQDLVAYYLSNLKLGFTGYIK
jgi:hypothetical protein